MNWRNRSIRGFKLRKPSYSAMPVRHTTSSNATVPVWVLTVVAVFSLLAGSYSAYHIAVADVYQSCATKGEWTWHSKLMAPLEPIKCSVPKSMVKE